MHSNRWAPIRNWILDPLPSFTFPPQPAYVCEGDLHLVFVLLVQSLASEDVAAAVVCLCCLRLGFFCCLLLQPTCLNL
ncbi:hypothetical protein C1H46_038387 [Malus baccata]|uniref:Uncharacterized protein n=1 Tax=Malus baccata TaxID=106549 RepID=A0A540KPC9_MALBA|nr:hypothetical protein C1H46_038387 [Malus baccata]